MQAESTSSPQEGLSLIMQSPSSSCSPTHDIPSVLEGPPIFSWLLGVLKGAAGEEAKMLEALFHSQFYYLAQYYLGLYLNKNK